MTPEQYEDRIINLEAAINAAKTFLMKIVNRKAGDPLMDAVSALGCLQSVETDE